MTVEIGLLQQVALDPNAVDRFERHTGESLFGELAVTRRHLRDVQHLSHIIVIGSTGC